MRGDSKCGVAPFFIMIYGTGSCNVSTICRTTCIRHRPDGSRNPPRRLRSVNRSHPHQETHEVASKSSIYNLIEEMQACVPSLVPQAYPHIGPPHRRDEIPSRIWLRWLGRLAHIAATRDDGPQGDKARRYGYAMKACKRRIRKKETAQRPADIR